MLILSKIQSYKKMIKNGIVCHLKKILYDTGMAEQSAGSLRNEKLHVYKNEIFFRFCEIF